LAFTVLSSMFGLQTEATADIDVFIVVIEMLGGLAIFLLGMDRMTEALRLIAGSRMRDVLARLTTNRFAGMATGAGITALIQSSSVTTVLVVGFISSGLMTLTQSLGVIIGANVGTTITAQIVAFKITSYSLIGVAVGFAMTFISKRPERQAWGTAILGLGLVFFGMTLMGDAMSPLRDSETFIDAMATLENPFLGIGVAALFTGLVQSSSATTGVVIALAQQDLINIQTGIALILGANVGTAITAILAALGKNREAMRAAAGHTLFNVLGVAIWLPLIWLLTDWVSSIGGPIERQIANAHTIFNVLNAFLFILFVPQLARLVTRILPDRGDDEFVIAAKHLDRGLFATPELALAHARQEIIRMGRRTRQMLETVLPALIDGTRWELVAVQELDDEVDALHEQVIDYLREIGAQKISTTSTNELTHMMDAANNLEAAADIIETNLVALGLTRVEQNLVVSGETRQVLEALHAKVLEGLDEAMRALDARDTSAIRNAERLKGEISRLELDAAAHQAQRLFADAPDRVATYRFEIDVIANLKRVHYFSTRTARASAPRHASQTRFGMPPVIVDH
jgi:phosphate:Na+ symporter